MLGSIRSRMTSAHLIGVAALVFAVGGSFALASVPRNSVGTKKLKNGAVTRAKIKDRAINGAKVAPNSLTGANINEATLNGGLIGGITLPTPPASGVQSVIARLAPNTSASIAAGGFTVTETTDAAGTCTVEEITASADGRYGEADLRTPDIGNAFNAIAAGATETLGALNAAGDYGSILAMADDGSGGGSFELGLANVDGRCVFTATAISA